MYMVIPFKEEYEVSYRSFVEKNFGKNSYQKSEKYLKWLYFLNPYGNGWKDFLLVVYNNSQVVGCVHKLGFELIDKSGIKNSRVSVIHNLMVDKEHRTGCGFLLLREVLKTEKNFIVPGVLGALSETYKNIGAQPLFASWWKKIILPNPISLLKRVFNLNIDNGGVKENFEKLAYEDLTIHFECPDFFINHVNDSSSLFDLSASFLNWRFFQNKKHSVFILKDKMSSSFLIAVVGKRKNVPVTRIIYTSFLNPESQNKLTLALVGLSKRIGSALVLLTSSQNLIATEFVKIGFKEKAISPDSYFFSTKINSTELNFWPLVSDLGFEEIFGG